MDPIKEIIQAILYGLALITKDTFFVYGNKISFDYKNCTYNVTVTRVDNDPMRYNDPTRYRNLHNDSEFMRIFYSTCDSKK